MKKGHLQKIVLRHMEVAEAVMVNGNKIDYGNQSNELNPRPAARSLQ